jgi:tetratricopeptide (TPR) repeat protein
MSKRRRRKKSKAPSAPAQPSAEPAQSSPQPASVVRPRVSRWLVAAIVFVSAFLLFVPTWKNPFVLDDIQKIEANPDMRLPFSLHNFVYPYSENATEFRNDPSRPLPFMVYWLCWHLGSGNPLPFHGANTGLHGLAAAFLALLVIELLFLLYGEHAPVAGGIAGLLFVTSPLLAGTAAYVYGLSDVLSTALGLAVLVLLVRSKKPAWWAVALSCLLFVLALASKQSLIVLPALVAACDLGAGGWSRVKARLAVYLPLLAVAAAYLAARVAYFGALGDLEGRGSLFGAGLYATLQGAMILNYLRMLVYPAGLTIDHLPQASHYPDGLRWLAWAVIAVLTTAALREGFRRKWKPGRRLLSLGWMLFLLSLLPTSSFLPTVDLLVERRAYFAAAGLFLVVAGLLWRRGRSERRLMRAAWAAAALAIILGQTAVTWQRNRLYGSTEGLWKEALDRNPMNRRALSNLGTYYSRAKRWDEAVDVFDRILKVNPSDGPIYSKLAYIYMQPGYSGHSDEKALEYMTKGLELNPTNILGLYNSAILYRRMNRTAEAEDLLRRAIRINPNFGIAYGLLGEIALGQKRQDEAVGYFREALRLDPGDQAAASRLRELTGR